MKHYHHVYNVFELKCWGNGLAYALTHLPSGLSVFLQGDDAVTFEQDRLSCEASFPDKTDDEIMMWLWDQCDYESAARPFNDGKTENDCSPCAPMRSA